jgi:hypothetical protein
MRRQAAGQTRVESRHHIHPVPGPEPFLLAHLGTLQGVYSQPRTKRLDLRVRGRKEVAVLQQRAPPPVIENALSLEN